MADELNRKTGRKLIAIPGTSSTVPVPCIMEITFTDPVRRYQDTTFKFDNSLSGDRTVHIDQVRPVDVDGVAGGGEPMLVERIDKWSSIDPVRRNQETQFAPDNVTGGDTFPPSFTTHEKTHVVRHYEDPNSPDNNGNWIDVEWIDTYRDVDPVRRYQERVFVLTNDDVATTANPDDPDITDPQEGQLDPPWRLSPFQNIVNFNGGTSEVEIEYFIWVYPPIPDAPPRWVPVEPDTGSTGFTGQTFSQMQRAWIQEKIDLGEADPIGGGWRGDRLLRSTLIADAANGSNIGSNNPASIYFNVTILGFGSLWNDYFRFYDSLFITPHPPLNPAPHGTWVYAWCSGSYITDDVTTA